MDAPTRTTCSIRRSRVRFAKETHPPTNEGKRRSQKLHTKIATTRNYPKRSLHFATHVLAFKFESKYNQTPYKDRVTEYIGLNYVLRTYLTALHKAYQLPIDTSINTESGLDNEDINVILESDLEGTWIIEESEQLLNQIQAARASELAAQARLEYLVRQARINGITWRAIGAAAEMRHSAAHGRWSDLGKTYERNRIAKTRQAARGELPFEEPVKRETGKRSKGGRAVTAQVVEPPENVELIPTDTPEYQEQVDHSPTPDTAEAPNTVETPQQD